jgi:hypothetical protein
LPAFNRSQSPSQSSPITDGTVTMTREHSVEVLVVGEKGIGQCVDGIGPTGHHQYVSEGLGDVAGLDDQVAQEDQVQAEAQQSNEPRVVERIESDHCLGAQLPVIEDGQVVGTAEEF